MKQILLISLDCLLDTRMGVLSAHYPEIANSIVVDPIKAKTYRNRIRDEFPDDGIDFETFKGLWETRTTLHLRKSILTPFVFELANITSQVVDQSIEAPHTISEFEIHINTYPYTDLSVAEETGIIEAVVARLHFPVMVRTVCLSEASLTPQYIKANNYTTTILYDFRKWLETQYHQNLTEADIERVKMPQFVIYAPSLMSNLDKLKELIEYRSPGDETIDPLHGIQFMFKPFFHLEYLGPEHFSIIDPVLFPVFEAENRKKMYEI